jgi:predicted O-methyltransferase YrrM
MGPSGFWRSVPSAVTARSGSRRRCNPHYFEWAVKLTKPGSVIVIDNVVRGGLVTDSQSDDPNIVGVRKVLEMVGKEPRVSGTAIQTVGTKGYDGLAIVLVNR